MSTFQNYVQDIDNLLNKNVIISQWTKSELQRNFGAKKRGTLGQTTNYLHDPNNKAFSYDYK